MQLGLRRGFGYAFDPGRGMRGLGQSGEVDVEGTGGPGGVVVSEDPIVSPSDPLLTDESGTVCLASMFVNGQCPIDAGANLANPGYGIVTTPGVALTPAELAAEQSRATAWLNQIPGALSVAGKIAALTSAQIAAGLQAGALKPSSTCPSGYMVAGSAQCAGVSASKPLIAGVSNTTLAIGAVVFLAFLMMGGKRR